MLRLLRVKKARARAVPEIIRWEGRTTNLDFRWWSEFWEHIICRRGLSITNSYGRYCKAKEKSIFDDKIKFAEKCQKEI